MNQMTNQVQAAPPKPQSAMTVFKSMLDSTKVQQRLQNALRDHKDTFVASLLDLYGGDPAIQECKPQDVIQEALKAASLMLPINKALGFAYIVVYKNNKQVTDEHGVKRWVKVPTPTFIPGYKGYIQLAMRTGQYRTINADVVYEGELQKADKLTGAISFDGEKISDKIIGYFCFFELLNGFRKTLYMTVDQMAEYAKKYSPSVPKDLPLEALKNLANPESTAVATAKKQVGWMGNFNDMALKTVIRKLLSKYGYLSVEMQSAMANDVEERDDAADSRSEMVSQTAAQAVNVEDTSYVDLDKTTGEIKESAPEPQAAPEEKEEEAPY